MKRAFTVTARLRSIGFALRGLGVMLRSQHNAWIHAAATVAAVAAGVFWRIERGEWIAVVLAVVAVWTAEALNTAFEFLADATNPTFHPLVGRAKDVAAAAVLIAAIGATIVGAIVFGPHLVGTLSGR